MRRVRRKYDGVIAAAVVLPGDGPYGNCHQYVFLPSLYRFPSPVFCASAASSAVIS